MKDDGVQVPEISSSTDKFFGSIGVIGRAILAAGTSGLAAFGVVSAQPHQASALTPDTSVAAGPFEFEVDRVFSQVSVATTDGEITPQTPDGRLLVVVATVTNVSTTPASLTTLKRILPAPHGVGVVDDEGRLVDDTIPPSDRPDFTAFKSHDGHRLTSLNPGITSEVALIWQQDGSAADAGAEVTIMEVRWVGEGVGGIGDRTWLGSDRVTHRGNFDVTRPDEESTKEYQNNPNGSS